LQDDQFRFGGLDLLGVLVTVSLFGSIWGGKCQAKQSRQVKGSVTAGSEWSSVIVETTWRVSVPATTTF